MINMGGTRHDGFAQAPSFTSLFDSNAVYLSTPALEKISLRIKRPFQFEFIIFQS